MKEGYYHPGSQQPSQEICEGVPMTPREGEVLDKHPVTPDRGIETESTFTLLEEDTAVNLECVAELDASRPSSDPDELTLLPPVSDETEVEGSVVADPVVQELLEELRRAAAGYGSLMGLRHYEYLRRLARRRTKLTTRLRTLEEAREFTLKRAARIEYHLERQCNDPCAETARRELNELTLPNLSLVINSVAEEIQWLNESLEMDRHDLVEPGDWDPELLRMVGSHVMRTAIAGLEGLGWADRDDQSKRALLHAIRGVLDRELDRGESRRTFSGLCTELAAIDLLRRLGGWVELPSEEEDAEHGCDFKVTFEAIDDPFGLRSPCSVGGSLFLQVKSWRISHQRVAPLTIFESEEGIQGLLDELTPHWRGRVGLSSGPRGLARSLGCLLAYTRERPNDLPALILFPSPGGSQRCLVDYETGRLKAKPSGRQFGQQVWEELYGYFAAHPAKMTQDR